MEDFEIIKIPSISAIFNESQLDNTHAPLINKLIRIFNETEVDEFTSAFVTCLKVALCTNGDVNISVDRVFEFASQFIIVIAGLDVPDNSHIDDEVFHFADSIFNFFKKHHDVPSAIVRKRICQFISRLLLRMSPDAMLACKICDIIINIMTERIKDKVPAIRLQAILSVHRLQERSDKNCPVTKTLINCIETDTSAEVRKLALSKVSLVHRYIISVIIDRTDDISEKVRKETYIVLSKLHIKQLTIEQRQRLLNTGLYDNNELVKSAVKSTLLPAWLKRLDYKFLDLLKALDLRVSSMEVTTKALMSLFHSTSHEIASETLKSLMDSIHLISYDKLTAESAFFWRCFVFFSSDLVSEKNNYNWESSKSYDATQDELLPDLSVFCEYIKMYYSLTSAEFSEEKPWKKKEQEFILIQLVELCKVYDYADEVGRKELKVLCLELLKNVEMETIRPIVELYFMLQTNLNESISKITELINDLLYPNNPSNATVRQEQNAEVDERILDPVQEQNIKYKIAQLNVKLTELKDLQEDAIKLEDFARAQELKSEISDIQDQAQQLRATLIGAEAASSCQMITDNDSEESEEEGGNPLDNLDTETVHRSLVMLQEMLHLSLLKQLTPELRTLFQMLVLPACKSDNVTIAALATEVMGSCCLRDKALAKEYFTTVFASCGNADICVSALKVIFDFLLCFGPSTFDINSLNDYEKKDENQRNSSLHGTNSSGSSTSLSENDEEISKNEQNKEKELETQEGLISGYTFISVLVDLLDDQFVEARFTVVHGLCKLMATGKLKSSKVLTRLILIWFHPASKESVEIRDCLNFFFPFFVKHCPWALQLFENSFIPTMDTLFNAPIVNPLNNVDQKCVLKVLCDLTNPNFAHDDPYVGENIHYNVAILLCNHIMDLKDSNHQIVLLRGLDYLDLSYTEPSMLPTVINLLAKISKKLKRKNLKKLLTDVKKIENKFSCLMKNRQKASTIANTVCTERNEENYTIDEGEEL